jgi:hypothetical protein
VGYAAGQLTDRLHFLRLTKSEIGGVLFIQQTVLLLDQRLHDIDGDLQGRSPGGR